MAKSKQKVPCTAKQARSPKRARSERKGAVTTRTPLFVHELSPELRFIEENGSAVALNGGFTADEIDRIWSLCRDRSFDMPLSDIVPTLAERHDTKKWSSPVCSVLCVSPNLPPWLSVVNVSQDVCRVRGSRLAVAGLPFRRFCAGRPDNQSESVVTLVEERTLALEGSDQCILGPRNSTDNTAVFEINDNVLPVPIDTIVRRALALKVDVTVDERTHRLLSYISFRDY